MKYVYKYFGVLFLVAKKHRHVLAVAAGLLGCQSMSTHKQLTTFQGIVVPS
jgi:hypothetical protein